jgi:preprotein translocase subunit SecG
MREQEAADSSLPRSTGSRGRIATDDAEQAQPQEYLTVSTQDKSVRKTTGVLAVLFAIGLLSLWFMIKKSGPRAAAAAGPGTTETKIEMAISRLTGIKAEMFSRMDEIVKKFYEFSDMQQIKVDELAKNPFKHDPIWANLKKVSDTDADLLRQQQLKEQADKLRLLSIIQSEQGNCCMIDDKILYEGDSINGFKITQIGESFVKLELDETESQGMEIVLKLSE